MKILAVDPGFGRVGIAVVTKVASKEVVLFSECFETDSSLTFFERLLLLGKHISEVIATHKPDVLAIENLFMAKNQKTAMHVSEARGVIIYEGLRNGLEVFEYTPLQIKVALTGYGKATKDQVAMMVGKITGIDVATKIDDEIDAIAVGITHMAYKKS